MSRIRLYFVLASIGLSLGLLSLLTGSNPEELRAANQPPDGARKSGVARFMRGKLDSAQLVLEGMVLNDMELVRKGAEQMAVMSRAAEWQVLQGPIYAGYSTEFQRLADRLAKQAESRQFESAALTYTQLTLTCMTCHKYVRSAEIVGLDPPRIDLAGGQLRYLDH